MSNHRTQSQTHSITLCFKLHNSLQHGKVFFSSVFQYCFEKLVIFHTGNQNKEVSMQPSATLKILNFLAKKMGVWKVSNPDCNFYSVVSYYKICIHEIVFSLSFSLSQLWGFFVCRTSSELICSIHALCFSNRGRHSKSECFETGNWFDLLDSVWEYWNLFIYF